MKWCEGLMIREREEAGRNIFYPIEQEVPTQASKIMAFRLEGKDTTGGSKLGGIEGIKADVSANVVEDISIAQIFAQPLYCLGLFGSVGVRTVVFVRCRDANGDGESIDLATSDGTNRTLGCTKPQHHLRGHSVQFGTEPSTHLNVPDYLFPIIPNLGQSCQPVLNIIAVCTANGDTNRADRATSRGRSGDPAWRIRTPCDPNRLLMKDCPPAPKRNSFQAIVGRVS